MFFFLAAEPLFNCRLDSSRFEKPSLVAGPMVTSNAAGSAYQEATDESTSAKKKCSLVLAEYLSLCCNFAERTAKRSTALPSSWLC